MPSKPLHFNDYFYLKIYLALYLDPIYLKIYLDTKGVD